MGNDDLSNDRIIAELLNMGFEFVKILEALEAVGPCLNDAVEFLLNDTRYKSASLYGTVQYTFTGSASPNAQNSSLVERADSLHSMPKIIQTTITDHLPSFSKMKTEISTKSSKPLFLGIKRTSSRPVSKEEVVSVENHHLKVIPETSQLSSHCNAVSKSWHSQQYGSSWDQLMPRLSEIGYQDNVLHWENKISDALQKHFGFSSLKGFQKDAIKAWLANKDCLILAATGSGKSLCFQIPAVLSGKVVIVISPLISLMHDQCLKLAKHGISACFLGSGQHDSTVEKKAMNGMYRIVYVCPETVLRLVEPLKRLAENNGIALFAIDEAHCVSKWGHDFRPDYSMLNISKAKRAEMEIFSHCTLWRKSNNDRGATTLVVMNDDEGMAVVVKHSKTSCLSSYEKDFRELVNVYTSSQLASSKGGTRTLVTAAGIRMFLLTSMAQQNQARTVGIIAIAVRV
ncbi:hypothetical protein HPP92_010398 [Vanilla planifolia]|uniref:DNA helicase n=1 Tax=Vanilla planifolia TaxID=51239 RepID=A0A835R0T7_VANPL|nr:hypothetical protein HPP92_010398 [Vanilla planifolia]